MKKALVVVDVQKYFVNEKTSDIPKKIATYIRENNFDFVLFSKFVNKKGSNWFRTLGWEKMTGPPDTDIHETLKEFADKNNVFEKTSYSVFKAQGFEKFLKKNDIEELYICGIDINACVLASALEAFDLGYTPHVLKELSASHSKKELDDAALAILDYLKLLSPPQSKSKN